MTRPDVAELLDWITALHGEPRGTLAWLAGAWQTMLSDVDPADAREACITWYRRSRDNLTPQLLRAEIHRNRVHDAIFGPAREIDEWLVWPGDESLS